MFSRDNGMKMDRTGTHFPLPFEAAKPHITYIEPNGINGKKVTEKIGVMTENKTCAHVIRAHT